MSYGGYGHVYNRTVTKNHLLALQPAEMHAPDMMRGCVLCVFGRMKTLMRKA
jgi:hypothetical protein